MVQLIARISLAIGFFLPIFDRLGLMGTSGSKGVTWGNWSNFVEYTNTLIPFISIKMASVMSFAATIIEFILGIGLLIGYKTKWMGLGTAIITVTFGACMFFSISPLAPFLYPVFVFTSTGLLLWKYPTCKWSLDHYLSKAKC